MENYKRGLTAGIPIALDIFSFIYFWNYGGVIWTILVAGCAHFDDHCHICRTVCGHRNYDASGTVFPDAYFADYY